MVLIPYQQGSLFRLLFFVVPLVIIYVLIPYQQGSLFRRRVDNLESQVWSLNPLSAGKSFQT